MEEHNNDILDRIQQIVHLSDNINNKLMENSDHSTGSTKNTDIYVLEANESHYGDIENSTFLDHHSNVEASFTVLNAPTNTSSPAAPSLSLMALKRKCNLKERFSSDEIDESTEVLMIINAEEKIQHLKSGISGTDSDVEVLMSEEIVDSDWSAAEDDLHQPNSCREKSKNDVKNKADESIQIKSFESNMDEELSGSIKHQNSTDHDISSVEDFSGDSLMGAYDKFSKKDLVNIIREQATRIEYLETQMNRYRSIQQTFFDYVSDLKLQLEDVHPEPPIK